MITHTAVNVGLFYLTLYVNQRGNKKLYKLYIDPTFDLAFHWFSVRCEMYSLWFKLYTNYTQNLTLNPTQNSTQRWQNPTQRAFRTLHSERSQNYTRSGTQTLHSVLWTRIVHEWNLEREWSDWSDWSESYVTFVTNVTNVKQEMAIGDDVTRHSCAPPQKSNNFESFFGDSTLTFLTFRNTFRLPILPTRRAVFLCLPLI